jgi:prevent-host-death family protein
MPTMTAAKARNKFADLLGQVTFAKERVTVTRRGRAVAAMVPIEDLKFLEAVEDQLDAQEALRALEEWEKKGKPTISWEQIKKDLVL